MPKWVYQFNSSNCEGTVSQKPLLGGKGANLAEMGKLAPSCSSGIYDYNRSLY